MFDQSARLSCCNLPEKSSDRLFTDSVGIHIKPGPSPRVSLFKIDCVIYITLTTLGRHHISLSNPVDPSRYEEKWMI